MKKMGNDRLSDKEWAEIVSHFHGLDCASGYSIVSPFELYSVTNARRILMESCRVQTVPCGVMLPAIGESENRYATQVGGLPAWPLDKPWPCLEGRRLRFFCQFNFTGYAHFFPGIPGKLLVVFHAGVDDLPFDFVFHWVDGEECPLVSDPEFATEVERYRGIFHGKLVKTYDMRLHQSSLLQAKKVARRHGMEYLRKILVHHGWKIGGIQQWEYPPKEPAPPHDSVFLCSITTIDAGTGEYPFVNRKRPYSYNFESIDLGHILLFYDGFTLNFYLHPDGRVSFREQRN